MTLVRLNSSFLQFSVMVDGVTQAGWETHFDSASGHHFYYNGLTGVTQWTKPELDSVRDPNSKQLVVGEGPTEPQGEGMSAAAAVRLALTGGGGGGWGGVRYQVDPCTVQDMAQDMTQRQHGGDVPQQQQILQQQVVNTGLYDDEEDDYSSGNAESSSTQAVPVYNVPQHESLEPQQNHHTGETKLYSLGSQRRAGNALTLRVIVSSLSLLALRTI